MAVLPKVALDGEALARLRAEVLAFMDAYEPPKLVITRGLDGNPRSRLMGVRHVGFTLYAVSIKPSIKLDELSAHPRMSVLWYQYDAGGAFDLETSVRSEGEQPLRLIEITGPVDLVDDVAAIRALPGRTYVDQLTDEELAAGRTGIVVQPERVRVEGFMPGPRYPVFLPID